MMILSFSRLLRKG